LRTLQGLIPGSVSSQGGWRDRSLSRTVGGGGRKTLRGAVVQRRKTRCPEEAGGRGIMRMTSSGGTGQWSTSLDGVDKTIHLFTCMARERTASWEKKVFHVGEGRTFRLEAKNRKIGPCGQTSIQRLNDLEKGKGLGQSKRKRKGRGFFTTVYPKTRDHLEAENEIHFTATPKKRGRDPGVPRGRRGDFQQEKRKPHNLVTGGGKQQEVRLCGVLLTR